MPGVGEEEGRGGREGRRGGAQDRDLEIRLIGGTNFQDDFFQKYFC